MTSRTSSFMADPVPAGGLAAVVPAAPGVAAVPASGTELTGLGLHAGMTVSKLIAASKASRFMSHRTS
jgi:hypothetical protein